MKKFSLTLTAFGFCLAFISATQAATTSESPMPSSPAATTPNVPNSNPDAGANVPPGGSGTIRHIRRSVETSGAIPDDPAVRKNEADFQAAKEKCNAIVAEDSKTKCMNEAETNYSKGKP